MAYITSQVEETVRGYERHAMRELLWDVCPEFRPQSETAVHHDDGGASNGRPLMPSLSHEFRVIRALEDAREHRRDHITPERVASILFQRFCSNLNTDLERWYLDGLLTYEAIIEETK
jgi:hypothetical protein